MHVVHARSPDFAEYRKRVKRPDHLMNVHGVAVYREQVDTLLDTPWELRGSALPWSKTDKLVRLRPGELSLWQGKNSHGKSSLLGQVLTWLAAQGERAMVASFEMPVPVTIERMLKQATGCADPTPVVRDEFFDKFGDNLFFYDHEGLIDPDLVLDLVEFSADVFGCKHIQVDSLTKVKGMIGDNLELQANFVNALHTVAKKYQIHVHLVVHERKGGPGSEAHISTRYDAKGSGAIPDQVDNVFIVWQDRDNVAAADPDPERPDVIIAVDKQRHGMWVGRISLYFAERDCWQFVPMPGMSAMRCPHMSF